MFKYWIMEISLTNNIKNKIKLLIQSPNIFKKEENKELILTYNGYYLINDNYILQEKNKEFQLIEDYLENYTLLIKKNIINKKKIF